ncbi:hypothetical protein DL766_010018 [Monosporascus sp. MC13-8B]|uniref:Acyltransferase 3 domain-containing protein n=1 Tax=Monosporascus cannonballus TaxID=155416 RepID=A0ABY0GTQ9_9PEZI|nr:hypothetical protein DL763_011196 [Monosporascus cannonballus]RYO76909.1 hypothetical protein DL762_009610 [Monosporascus cannonballus]RYP11751.1 hypothetical protein DL766_010018 [Monosporascus sp. MC13-8B]
MFWQLPIIRVLHSGRGSVTIFFIMSGYVVTVKTVSKIHKRQPDQVLHSLSGSLFRRAFRLYIPIIVSTLIILALVRLDAFQPDPTGRGAPPRAETLQEQLQHWYEHTVYMINPFRAITGRVALYSPPYDGHLWTIPVEFKGSVTVFTLLLAFARTRLWIRLAGVLALGCWLVQFGDFDQALFCAGLLLAEISCLVPLNKSASHTTSTTLSPYWHWRNCFAHAVRHAWTIALFILALHLLSYPEIQGPATPGFRTISKLVPGFYKGNWERIQQFWISVGSVLFIVALILSPPLHLPPMVRWRRNTSITTGIEASADPDSAALPPSSTTLETQHPLLQRPFTTRFAQYLGRISYSLYLAHGAVDHTVCVRWLNPAMAAWRRMEAVDAADAALARAWRDYCAQALCAALINTLVLIWVSDLFWRAIDARAVKVARWLWVRALVTGAE